MAQAVAAESNDPFRTISHPELFFGIVGPVGVDLSLVCDILQQNLKRVRYDSDLIRLSGLLKLLTEFERLPSAPEDERIAAFMDAGTALRERTQRGEMLSLLSVIKIRELREKITKNPTAPAERRAYVFRSLKHPEEVHALRDIYGRLFFLISAYAPRAKRVDNMSKIISQSHGRSNQSSMREEAEKLVSRDEEEEGKKLGQDVTDAFPLADFFVNAASRKDLETGISRMIDIIFGHPFHTPTPDEMGMYLAKASALRSADLSRQVGAVISTPDGEVISVGCNEVPSAKGGLYWPGEDDDRDFQVGYDSSAKSKYQIIKEVIEKFHKANNFSARLMNMSTDDITNWILFGDGQQILQGAQIFDLLEFGRPVHAEMAAITGAARRGVSVEGATLFSTTFPCHMCARHIISSGIKKVVYIEPYPKSKVTELYSRAVSVDETDEIKGKVRFCSFVGVAPRRYQEFFEKVVRKTPSGDRVNWEPQRSSPRVRRFIATYVELETNVILFVQDKLEETGFKFVS